MSDGAGGLATKRRRRVVKLAILAAFSCAAAGCRTGSSPNPTQRVDAVAQDYVELVLALGERDVDSLDFAVVSPTLQRRVHDRYASLDAIGAKATALQARLPSAKDGLAGETALRAEFLRLQLGAVAARVDMLRGHLLPFDQEAMALFGVRALPEDASAKRAAIRAQVSALLPAGKGDPAERYGRYEARFLVPQDRLRAVMQAALAACRTQTVAHLALPAGEAVDLEFVRNQPWAAFSRYTGGGHSTIRLNVDLPVTVDEALELACHEGYPGHHVYNTLRDAALAQGKHWPEAEVQPTFSPQSYVSEAAAAYAPRLAFTVEERIRVEREVLFPLAGLRGEEADRYIGVGELMRGLDSAEPGIARDYLDGSLEYVRAGDALRREVLMAWADSLLLYLNEYRSYMLAYTDGPRRVEALLGADRERAWGKYRELMMSEVYQLPDVP